MIRFFTRVQALKYGKLMELYEEDLQACAKQSYPHLPAQCAIMEAQQDFYAYLQDVFFRTEGAIFALLEEEDRYLCAMRLEPFEDGFLLCGIMTARSYRRQGYARQLLQETVKMLPAGTKLYSHVQRDNDASRHLHLACGFQLVPGPVKMLNGEVLHNFLGFLLVV